MFQVQPRSLFVGYEHLCSWPENMGEGVSLSLPLPVANLLVISREHGVYGKINLLLLAHRTTNGHRDTPSSEARHALTISDRQDLGFLGAGVLT